MVTGMNIMALATAVSFLAVGGIAYGLIVVGTSKKRLNKILNK